MTFIQLNYLNGLCRPHELILLTNKKTKNLKLCFDLKEYVLISLIHGDFGFFFKYSIFSKRISHAATLNIATLRTLSSILISRLVFSTCQFVCIIPITPKKFFFLKQSQNTNMRCHQALQCEFSQFSLRGTACGLQGGFLP